MFTEIYHNLFVGSQADYEELTAEEPLPEGSFVCHAAKIPYHKEFVGYTGNGAPKDSPEYLKAVRGNRLALNIVDAPKPEFFDKKLIMDTVRDILSFLDMGAKVYVHCNKGESRAPSIGLLCLVGLNVLSPILPKALEQFQTIYPDYNPGEGIKAFVEENWAMYNDYYDNTQEEQKRVDPLDVLPWENTDINVSVSDDDKAIAEKLAKQALEIEQKKKKAKHRF